MRILAHSYVAAILVVAAILLIATAISRHELQFHALVLATKRVRRRHRVTSRRTRKPDLETWRPGAVLSSAVTGRAAADTTRW